MWKLCNGHVVHLPAPHPCYYFYWVIFFLLCKIFRINLLISGYLRMSFKFLDEWETWMEWKLAPEITVRNLVSVDHTSLWYMCRRPNSLHIPNTYSVLHYCTCTVQECGWSHISSVSQDASQVSSYKQLADRSAQQQNGKTSLLVVLCFCHLTCVSVFVYHKLLLNNSEELWRLFW